MNDNELAVKIAEEAGALLLKTREGFTGESGDRALGDKGDRDANIFILESLRAQRPEDCVLSEESEDDHERLRASRVWIVDPLDGTREYREGRDDWAVHIALSIDGAASLGAVALPSLGLVMSTLNPPSLPNLDSNKIRMVVSRTRPSPMTLRICEVMGGELIEMGSAGAKAMAVARGEAEIYAHSGGQYQWDNCAPVAVAAAAGLHVSRLDGSPLLYNGPDASLPDLLICRHEYAEQAISIARGEA